MRTTVDEARVGVHARIQKYLNSDYGSGPVPPSLEPGHGLWQSVADEVRWSFTGSRHWLEGLAANIVLSLLYLLISPLAGSTTHRHGMVILVGTYFATFILADVTTTNVLGVDAHRVRVSTEQGTPLRRILLIKNLALLAIVGLPTLALTAIFTIADQRPKSLAVTLPEVALPILAWLGIGNIVSVLLAVPPLTLAQRWRERFSWRTAGWILHLALPYGLYYLVAPIDGTQREVLFHLGHHVSPWLRADLHALVGLAVWVLGTVIALYIVRRRGLRVY
ncbi:hypothetical protein [Nocardia sp. NBC_01327]|uniref:hypothetical protein n=1 Tax=Nocardia sp. NBC_01327 TaxID=2903593 RepID=UPI002E144866|nr:hypothetical protein OG326_09265 [Nocardia sp. NBC_01327]